MKNTMLITFGTVLSAVLFTNFIDKTDNVFALQWYYLVALAVLMFCHGTLFMLPALWSVSKNTVILNAFLGAISMMLLCVFSWLHSPLLAIMSIPVYVAACAITLNDAKNND